MNTLPSQCQLFISPALASGLSSSDIGNLQAGESKRLIITPINSKVLQNP
jgi:hypothetical protein